MFAPGCRKKQQINGRPQVAPTYKITKNVKTINRTKFATTNITAARRYLHSSLSYSLFTKFSPLLRLYSLPIFFLYAEFILISQKAVIIFGYYPQSFCA